MFERKRYILTMVGNRADGSFVTHRCVVDRRTFKSHGGKKPSWAGKGNKPGSVRRAEARNGQVH